MQITFTLSDENAVFVRNFLVTHDIPQELVSSVLQRAALKELKSRDPQPARNMDDAALADAHTAATLTMTRLKLRLDELQAELTARRKPTARRGANQLTQAEREQQRLLAQEQREKVQAEKFALRQKELAERERARALREQSEALRAQAQAEKLALRAREVERKEVAHITRLVRQRVKQATDKFKRDYPGMAYPQSAMDGLVAGLWKMHGRHPGGKKIEEPTPTPNDPAQDNTQE
jgi:hypothetical protein